ncbi:MAG: molecular chaperone HtpG, partial [Chloroflexi bacterium]|nr:molecular chaperone HtpG [Chloroflexota bacterium]
EMLTNREVLDPQAELAVWITSDPDARTLTVRDSGIGMTRAELVENLGTIAHSGAKAFLEAARQQRAAVGAGETPGGGQTVGDMIGQFGVGFYSVFMVAEQVRVTSRSYRPEAQAATWVATGGDSYTLQAAEKADRGTVIEIKLKEDAQEFSETYRLNGIVKRHSDFIAYPIFVGKAGAPAGEASQANQQTAVWRQSPREVEAEKYADFYKQLTLDFEAPLRHIHYVADAPVQIYALLFVPAKGERGFLSLRKEDGLKLYSHKVLIREYFKDLLPQHLRFVEGVVDSDDIPLNLSRESARREANPVMARIKRALTKKVIDELKALAGEDAEKYGQFWSQFGRHIKEGVATDTEGRADLYPLLRFHTSTHPDELVSLADYTGRMKDGRLRGAHPDRYH